VGGQTLGGCWKGEGVGERWGLGQLRRGAEAVWVEVVLKLLVSTSPEGVEVGGGCQGLEEHGQPQLLNHLR
jgi:hypothetical protein